MEIAYSTVLEYLEQEDEPTDWGEVIKNMEHKTTEIKANKIISTYGKKE